MNATIVDTPFPDVMAILPSDGYVFDRAGAPELSLRVVARRTLSNGLIVVVTNCGPLCFDFAATPLGGFRRLDFQGEGEVPEESMRNRDELVTLLVRRMRMAVFAAACVYGTAAHLTRSQVRAPVSPSLDEIYAWHDGGGTVLMPTSEIDRLRPRLIALARSSTDVLTAHVEAGLALADRLIGAAAAYVEADPVALMTMTYQSMVLHARQHPGASIALSAVVIEGVVEELMFAAGLVASVDARLPPSRRAGVTPVSKRRLKDLGFNGRLDALAEAGLINAYLRTRIDAVRSLRNRLMHEGEDAEPSQSGQALTAVRDLLRICTEEHDFELLTSWSYRF